MLGLLLTSKQFFLRSKNYNIWKESQMFVSKESHSKWEQKYIKKKFKCIFEQ